MNYYRLLVGSFQDADQDGNQRTFNAAGPYSIIDTDDDLEKYNGAEGMQRKFERLPGPPPRFTPYPRQEKPKKSPGADNPGAELSKQLQEQRPAGRPGSEPGSDLGQVGPDSPAGPRPGEPKQENPSPNFDGMTKAELRSYAEEHEIDISQAHNREDLLKAVKGS